MHGQPAGIKAWALAVLKDKSWVGKCARLGAQGQRKQISSPSWQPECNCVFYFPPCIFTSSFLKIPATHTHTHVHTYAHTLIHKHLTHLHSLQVRLDCVWEVTGMLTNLASCTSLWFLHVVGLYSILNGISFVSALENKHCVMTFDKIWDQPEKKKKKPYLKMWFVDTQGQETPALPSHVLFTLP